MKVVDVWVVFQYGPESILSKEMYLCVRYLFFQTTHHWRSQYYIANGRKPDDEKLGQGSCGLLNVMKRKIQISLKESFPLLPGSSNPCGMFLQ